MFVNTIDWNSRPLIFGIPLFIIAVAVAFAMSSQSELYPEIAAAVVYDLTLSAPIAYLLLIRKTGIPKITVVPLFTAGLTLATFLTPTSGQFHVDIVKYWLLPVVEIGVLIYVGIAAYGALKLFRAKHNETPDVYSALRSACFELIKKTSVIPAMIDRVAGGRRQRVSFSRWLGDAFAFELAVFYYGLIRWRPLKTESTAYSYHRRSGIFILYSAVMFILVAETTVIHILLMQWNAIIAWVITVPSVYVIIQIFAHLKAMYLRPIQLLKGRLIVRNGLFGESTIELENIESIEVSPTPPVENNKAKHAVLLKGLEQVNTKVVLKRPAVFVGIYGFKTEFSKLLFFVDEQDRLKNEIDNYEPH